MHVAASLMQPRTPFPFLPRENAYKCIQERPRSALNINYGMGRRFAAASYAATSMIQLPHMPDDRHGTLPTKREAAQEARIYYLL